MLIANLRSVFSHPNNLVLDSFDFKDPIKFHIKNKIGSYIAHFMSVTLEWPLSIGGVLWPPNPSCCRLYPSHSLLYLERVTLFST